VNMIVPRLRDSKYLQEGSTRYLQPEGPVWFKAR
jgi:hypothetical protein